MSEKLSDKVISIVEEKIGEYPSMIQSGWYPLDVIMSLIDRGNKEIWYNHFIDKDVVRFEGLIQFSENSTYIYYKKGSETNTYWFVVLTNEVGREGVMFYLNKIKNQKIKDLPWL
tara:strand:+ start:2116 stop:2460 length:345 start_codon:yes stop_codon:yes gene_type:complete